MQQIHEKLDTKNAEGVLEAVDNQQNLIQKLVNTAPIVVTVVINPVTGALQMVNSPLQNPKNDLRIVLSALRKAEDTVTQALLDLAENSVEDSVNDNDEDSDEE